MRSIPPALRTTALVVVAVALVAVVEPSVLRSSIRSPRALLLLAGAGLGVALLSRVVHRRWGASAGRVARVGLVIALALALLVPALRQTELDEPLPQAVAAVAPTTAPTAVAMTAPTTTIAAASAAAQRLTSGELVGIGHDATGDVAVHRLADGSVVVRFEGADIKGAPDPVLYLVPGEGRRTREGGVEVGPLRATKGNFNQTVTPDFDFDQPFTVFVWCERFATPIAAADQAP